MPAWFGLPDQESASLSVAVRPEFAAARATCWEWKTTVEPCMTVMPSDASGQAVTATWTRWCSARSSTGEPLAPIDTVLRLGTRVAVTGKADGLGGGTGGTGVGGTEVGGGTWTVGTIWNEAEEPLGSSKLDAVNWPIALDGRCGARVRASPCQCLCIRLARLELPPDRVARKGERIDGLPEHIAIMHDPEGGRAREDHDRLRTHVGLEERHLDRFAVVIHGLVGLETGGQIGRGGSDDLECCVLAVGSSALETVKVPLEYGRGEPVRNAVPRRRLRVRLAGLERHRADVDRSERGHPGRAGVPDLFPVLRDIETGGSGMTWTGGVPTLVSVNVSVIGWPS